MAYGNIGLSHLDRLGLKVHFLRVRETLAARAARRRAYIRTVSELQSLSDRDLADFGFHRSEIPRIAREAAEGQVAQGR
jgi:uncharacterized protein YjiS (DUF1127 family)